MMTLHEEQCNCKIAQANISPEENEINKEDLCKKICENVLQGLLEGYEELKEKHPEKKEEFQPRIDEIKKQIQENKINQQIDEILSL